MSLPSFKASGGLTLSCLMMGSYNYNGLCCIIPIQLTRKNVIQRDIYPTRFFVTTLARLQICPLHIFGNKATDGT